MQGQGMTLTSSVYWAAHELIILLDGRWLGLPTVNARERSKRVLREANRSSAPCERSERASAERERGAPAE